MTPAEASTQSVLGELCRGLCPSVSLEGKPKPASPEDRCYKDVDLDGLNATFHNSHCCQHHSSALVSTSPLSVEMERGACAACQDGSSRHHPLIVQALWLEVAVKNAGSHTGRTGRREHSSPMKPGAQLNTQQKALP